jgi:GNAT superfamily N-acetyltransferase
MELLGGVDALVESTARWYLTWTPMTSLDETIAGGRDGFERLAAVLPSLGTDERRRARTETVERLVGEASRVVGVYADGRQVGFARAVTDGVSFVYLADVYVLEELRGRGVGVELVREMVENGPYADRKWLLHTEDAHDLYRKLGFDAPDHKVMERVPPRG